MADKTSPGRAGVVSMADVARSRTTSERIDEDFGSDDEGDVRSGGNAGEPQIQKVKFERKGESDMQGGESRMRYVNDPERNLVS